MKPLLVLLFVVLAAPAEAARVRVQVIPAVPDSIREDISDSDQFVLLTAGHGERNRVTVRKRPHHALVVQDAGARLRPGSGCRRLTRHEVRCRFDTDYSTERLVAQLRDRDDRFRVRGILDATVFGGKGDDLLVGGRGNDLLGGASGDDILVGRRGSDTLSGSTGADQLAGGPGADDLTDGPGRDVLRGGPATDILHSTDATSRDSLYGDSGRDLVTYARETPASIALSSGAGEDDVVGVEDVLGSFARDVIKGDARANRIDGNGGDDVIDAGDGDDRVAGRAAEDITCGAGADALESVYGGAPLLRPDCERVVLEPFFHAPAQPVSVTADAVTLSLPCETSPRSLTLVTPPAARPWFPDGPFGTVVAAGPQPAGRGGECAAVLTLTAAGRSLPRPLPVTINGAYATWSFLLGSPS